MIQSLFDGCDASRVPAADHIADLFGKFQLLFLDDLLVFYDIDRDIVIDESENIQIHEVDRALDLNDIFLAHLIAPGILDDGDTAVQLVEVQVFIDIHASSRLDMVEDEALRDTSYIQCTFYHNYIHSFRFAQAQNVMKIFP